MPVHYGLGHRGQFFVIVVVLVVCRRACWVIHSYIRPLTHWTGLTTGFGLYPSLGEQLPGVNPIAVERWVPKTVLAHWVENSVE